MKWVPELPARVRACFETLLALKGHADAVWSVAFSPDDQSIVTGIAGATALVGAWVDDDRGTDSGSAYMFDLGCGCAADFNGDAEVDTRDVLAFLNAWTASDPATASVP